MEMQRNFGDLLQGCYQFIGVIRGYQACHILDTEGVRAHLFDNLRLLYIVLEVVHFTAHTPLGQGVADAALDVLAGFLDGPEGRLEVSRIVNRIENPEDVQTAFACVEAELSHDVISIVSVANDVLTAKEHHQFGVGHQLSQLYQSRPGVFIQKSGRYVKGGTTPDFHAEPTNFIHRFRNGDHVLRSHSGRQRRLVTITKSCIRDLKRICCCFLFLLCHK